MRLFAANHIHDDPHCRIGAAPCLRRCGEAFREQFAHDVGERRPVLGCADLGPPMQRLGHVEREPLGRLRGSIGVSGFAVTHSSGVTDFGMLKSTTFRLLLLIVRSVENVIGQAGDFARGLAVRLGFEHGHSARHRLGVDDPLAQ